MASPHLRLSPPMFLLLTVILCCFAGVTRSRQQDSFYFDPSPLGAEVVEGDQTRLRCDVSNRNHIAFYWTLDDRPVTNDSRRFQQDSDLRILRVERKLDSGSFRCIATNLTTGMSLRSIEARLSILCKYCFNGVYSVLCFQYCIFSILTLLIGVVFTIFQALYTYRVNTVMTTDFVHTLLHLHQT